MAAVARRAAQASRVAATLKAAAQPQRNSSTAGAPVRAANPGMRVTIFGAYGFVGRYVTSLLAASGVQCVIPWRGDDMEWRHLKVNGDLGIVAPVPFSPRDDDSIRRAVEGSDVVINLIGKDYETRSLPFKVNYSFEETHVTIAAKIAKLATQAGATGFIHMSSLAADPFAASAWARSKAAGEQAVRAEAPGATIVRPADVFGPEDRFLNLFAMLNQRLPRVPLVNGGTARVQPLHVHDLAHAIYRIAVSEDPEVMLGQAYDIAGPEEYTYKEVVEYVAETTRIPGRVFNASPRVAEMLGGALEQFPNPLLTRDRLLRMQSDVVLDELAPTLRLHDLGIEATSMESPGFTFLHRYRSGSHLLDLRDKDLY